LTIHAIFTHAEPSVKNVEALVAQYHDARAPHHDPDASTLTMPDSFQQTVTLDVEP
jgi:hypothetical protein